MTTANMYVYIWVKYPLQTADLSPRNIPVMWYAPKMMYTHILTIYVRMMCMHVNTTTIQTYLHTRMYIHTYDVHACKHHHTHACTYPSKPLILALGVKSFARPLKLTSFGCGHSLQCEERDEDQFTL